MQRKFAFEKEPYGDRGFRTVVKLKCRICGKTESIRATTSDGQLFPDQILEQKLREKGWFTGRNADQDHCKDCEIVPIAHAKAEKPKAEPPREMTFEHKRIINSKLEEVYLDAQRGYAEGWGDNRVAQELGCPRKWVEDMREANFGPVRTNPEMQAFLDEANQFLAESRTAFNQAKEFLERADAFLSFAKAERSKIMDVTDRLSKLEALAAKISKMGAL